MKIKLHYIAELDHPKRGVILSGHMDVVPVEGQKWTSNPFALTDKGDGNFMEEVPQT